jgi:hypothetical protein
MNNKTTIAKMPCHPERTLCAKKLFHSSVSPVRSVVNVSIFLRENPHESKAN